MRHVLSLIAGLVIAPVAWLLIGLGQTKLSDVEVDDAGLVLSDAAVPLGLLAAAGLLIGLIATTKVSPVGPTLAGLFFLVGQLVFVVDRRLILDNTPHRILGEEFVVAIPAASGTATILGVAMLISVFSVARWRKVATDDDADTPFASADNDLLGAPRPSMATSAAAETRSFPPYQPFGGTESGSGGVSEAPTYPSLSGRRGTTYGGRTTTEEDPEDTVRIGSESGSEATTVLPPSGQQTGQQSGSGGPHAGSSGGSPLWPSQGGQQGGPPWPSPPTSGSGGSGSPGTWPPSSGGTASQDPWSQPPSGSGWPAPPANR